MLQCETIFLTFFLRGFFPNLNLNEVQLAGPNDLVLHSRSDVAHTRTLPMGGSYISSRRLFITYLPVFEIRAEKKERIR